MAEPACYWRLTGVWVPVHTGNDAYDFTDRQKVNKTKRERYIKRLQRRLARQQKGSGRRQKTKQRIARQHSKVASIRKDFCHKTSPENGGQSGKGHYF